MRQSKTAISRGEALDLIRQPLPELLENAERLRRSCSGSGVEFCAIINIRSGDCDMDCHFCAQSRGRGAASHPLPELGDLAMRIGKLAKTPVAHIGLVASGGALGNADLEKICRLVKDLPAPARDKICVSLGRLGNGQMEKLREAGVARYHHNLETSSSFYPAICRTQTWKSRRDTARRALEMGFSLCSGGLFGMGESWGDRIELAFSLAETGCENLPMNFLDPRPGTPLAHMPHMGKEEALRIVALYRHILPAAVLRVCGGRCLAFGEDQHQVFRAGANALMTGDFLTTRGFGLQSDLAMIQRLGLHVVPEGLAAEPARLAN